MKLAEEYKRQPREGERLAKRSQTEIERIAYWPIVESWRDLEAIGGPRWLRVITLAIQHSYQIALRDRK